MSRVTVAATEDLVAIAEAAGADPSKMVYYVETSELECLDVDQATLDAALVSVNDGSASVTMNQIVKKIEALADSARATIESGFQSTADDLHASPKWYDSQVEDQLNLTGNVASMLLDTDSTIHACRDTQGATAKSYINHTKKQLRKVLRDGRDRKLTVLIEFNMKKQQCLAATTKAELDAITWTMT